MLFSLRLIGVNYLEVCVIIFLFGLQSVLENLQDYKIWGRNGGLKVITLLSETRF